MLHAETQTDARDRILDAALSEFSAHGLAGARTETIAAAAQVNKALLYYYFQSKENLYNATLERAADRVLKSSLAALCVGVSPGERLLRNALNHFDRILSQREFQNLMQQEMIRVHKGESSAMPILVERVFAPLHQRFEEIVRDGIASGELIDVDWMQMALSSLGANVFYFLSAPIWRQVRAFEPFAPAVLAERRKALVTYLGQAVFTDRQQGAEAAARVLADTPMPEFKEEELMRTSRFEGKP